MTDYHWTPAPKRGIIPFHPLPFGTILGKSFAVLRQNPVVLFGFAVVSQFVLLLITVAGMGGIMVSAVSRMESVSSDDYEDFGAISAGAILLMVLGGAVLSVLSLVLGVIVQGIVTANARAAVLGQKAKLSQLWQQVKPAFWRLLGYTLLVGLAIGVLFVVLFIAAVPLFIGLSGSGDAGAGAAFLILVLLILGSAVLLAWLSTMLLRVPSVLLVEHATIGQAVARSWRLTKGNFWFSFGIIVLIGLIFGMAAQMLGVPMNLFAAALGGTVMPMGQVDTLSGVVFMFGIMLLSQALLFVVQAIGAVVQSTGAALLYFDSRMRIEGLDHALIAYTDQVYGGVPAEQLQDPFAVPAAPQPMGYYYPQQGYPQPGYQAPPPGYQVPPPGYGPPQQGYPPQPPQPPQQTGGV